MESTYQKLQGIKKRAIAPYSHYMVGALVHTEKGDFEGFNIECSVYPLTICAERVALFNALVQGAKEIRELSLITDSVSDNGTPCGSCRQVLADHMDPDAKINVYTNEGKLTTYTVRQLLPYAFVTKELEGKGK